MTKKGIIYETLGKVSDLQIQESQNSNEVRLSGVFGVCGIKNGNNRIYEKSNYGKMVGILQEQIMNEGVVGELEHPNTMNINLENISHKIEAIQMNEDGTVTGTIKLLDTPKGKIAKELINGGCPLYISSRGAGSIDESGHVTLSTIKTYDLVGTPGFSQAKLNLDKHQTLESLNESLENPCWMIVESIEEDPVIEKKDDEEKTEDEPKDAPVDPKEDDTDGDNKSEKDNKDNEDNKVTMEDIKKSIDQLTQKVTDLEAQLHIAESKLEEAQNELANKKEVNYAAIQEWVEKEFAPVFESKVNETISEGLQAWITESYSPIIQEWVTEHYNEEVQNWVNEQYSERIQNWIASEVAPAIEGWIAEEYSPTIEKYINEEFSPMISQWVNEEVLPEHKRIITEEVNKNVCAFLESQKESKFDSIDKMLEKLSESAVKGNDAAQEILKESQTSKFKGCWAVENMPNQYRPMWEGLSEAKQAEIVKHSRMYDFTKEGVLEKFWASQKLSDTMISESQEQKNAAVAKTPFNSIAAAMMKLRK